MTGVGPPLKRELNANAGEGPVNLLVEDIGGPLA
jgi:hypothetical protein